MHGDGAMIGADIAGIGIICGYPESEAGVGNLG